MRLSTASFAAAAAGLFLAPAAFAHVTLNPDKVPAKVLLGAAVDALSAMTREAASRPDPRHTIAGRIRRAREQK